MDGHMHHHSICYSYRIHCCAQVSDHVHVTGYPTWILHISLSLAFNHLLFSLFRLRTVAKKLLEMPERRVSIKENKWGHNGDTTGNFKDGLTNANLKRAENLQLMSMLLEKFSFAGLAIIFVVFNLIYWPWLLYSPEQYIKGKYMQ